MKDTGFSFTTVNDEQTVKVKLQLHWNHDTDFQELDRLLTQVYWEARLRAERAT